MHMAWKRVRPASPSADWSRMETLLKRTSSRCSCVVARQSRTTRLRSSSGRAKPPLLQRHLRTLTLKLGARGMRRLQRPTPVAPPSYGNPSFSFLPRLSGHSSADSTANVSSVAPDPGASGSYGRHPSPTPPAPLAPAACPPSATPPFTAWPLEWLIDIQHLWLVLCPVLVQKSVWASRVQSKLIDSPLLHRRATSALWAPGLGWARREVPPQGTWRRKAAVHSLVVLVVLVVQAIEVGLCPW